MAGGTRATAATCTGSSEIEGLGRVGSSTTLASTQINYATLTVTAGRAMLAAASEAAAQSTDSLHLEMSFGGFTVGSCLLLGRWGLGCCDGSLSVFGCFSLRFSEINLAIAARLS
jgi:hypothetical protein